MNAIRVGAQKRIGTPFSVPHSLDQVDMKSSRSLALGVLLLATPVLGQSRPSDDGPPALEIPGGDIFGFTSPTDVGSPGDRGVAFELTNRVAKPGGGTYWSPTLKTQFSGTVAENLAVAISPFVTGHRIRSVPDLNDRSSLQFDGVSGEIAYRFLERTPTNQLAATVSVEPRAARVDALTGERVPSYSAEFKLFADAVLVPRRLYAAVNLNYALGTQRALSDFDAKWQNGSGTNVSGALTYQLNERLFIGGEVRWLTAFSGAVFNDFGGHGLFVGPTLSVKLSDSVAFSAVWTPQVAGHAQGVDRSLDLDNFERHQFRAKLSTSF